MFDAGLEKLPRIAVKMVKLTALLAVLVSCVGCAETPSEEMAAASLSAKDLA